jgi:glutamate---cysteine ligase / carboxylate-amine ligase
MFKNTSIMNRKMESIEFNPSQSPLSLGVELELQVLDEETLQLSPRAAELIDVLADRKFKKEFFQSTIEVVTGICHSVQMVEEDLRESLHKLLKAAKALHLKISSTGTHPEADYRDRLITPSARYHELADRNQWIIRRMAVYGMHIHVGMPSADTAIQFNNFLLHFTPHVLALSASSPFWQRMDTGLAAARPTVYESMPTSGMPYLVKDWKQFQKLYKNLLRTSSIGSIRDLWWDVRPSPMLGTVELRICDEPATLEEAMAIVAFVHLLAHWFLDHADEWHAKHKSIHRWVLRENKWRAIRLGLQAQIIAKRRKKLVGLPDDIAYWLGRVNSYSALLHYEKYLSTIARIVEKGNSSQRQHRVFAESNNLHDVTCLNISEFERGFS